MWLTPVEIAFLSRFVPGASLRALRYTEGAGPFWFLVIFNQAAVTWPWPRVVFVRPRYWRTYGYAQRLSILVHEAVHLGQYQAMGTLGFLGAYLKAWRSRHLRDGASHPMEEVAYSVQAEAMNYFQAHPPVLPLPEYRSC